MAETWKRAYLVRRNPALTEAAFPARWRRHAELGSGFPEIVHRNRRLRYCLVDHAAGAAIGAARDYDGVGMLWLRDPALLDAPLADERAIPTMRADELEAFHQPAFGDSVIVAETVLAGAPAGAPTAARVAVLTFARLRQGLAPADWVEAGRGLALPGLRRHVRGTAVRPPTIAFDGLDEAWFDDRAAAIEASRIRPSDPGAAAVLRLLAEVCHERES